MRPYLIFRLLAGVCLILVFAVSALYVTDMVLPKWFAISSAVLAVLATVFAALMQKPHGIQKVDIAAATDRLLLTYDRDTFAKLREAKLEERELRDFIEYKADEIFYLRLRSYLQDELQEKYKGSEIAHLISEIKVIEGKLDSLNVEYDEARLPERFQEFLGHLEKKQVVELAIEMIEATPFLPFKGLFKVYIKARYLQSQSASDIKNVELF